MFSRAYRTVITVPPLLWVAVFLLVPYLLMFCYSFWSVSPSQTIVHSWSLENYRQLLRVECVLANAVALHVDRGPGNVVFAAAGYPLAYFLSFHAGAAQGPLLPAGHHSAVGQLSGARLRVEDDPWQRRRSEHAAAICAPHSHPLDFLLYSPFAVVLTLTHIYTPFTFLPIYASLEHIPRNLVEASHDLGASPAQTFWRVIFPLSIPGVLAGATFAFVLSLGDFLAPLLLGGPSGIMISNIVVSLFGAAYNWPLGAAISFCMLVLVVGLLFVSERLEKKWSFR